MAARAATRTQPILLPAVDRDVALDDLHQLPQQLGRVHVRQREVLAQQHLGHVVVDETHHGSVVPLR